MVRWVILTVLVIGISSLAAWVALRTPANDVVLGGVPVAPDEKGPLPKLVVDQPLIHEFGMMGQQKKGQHQWNIKNEGPGDLILKGSAPSCSCTVLNLKQGKQVTLKPGETYTLNVEWETRANNGEYEKNASVFSNDPRKEELVFRIKGTVRPPLLMAPPNGILDMRNVASSGPHEFFAALVSPDRPETKITKITTTKPELIEVRTEPLKEDEAKELGAKAGFKLHVTVKPTDHLGDFNEEIIIETDHPDRKETRFALVGRMVGAISVIPNAVRLSDVSSSKGASSTVNIWVQDQPSTAFSIAKVPDHLKVSIVSVDEKVDAKTATGPGRAYRMTVTVVPDTPPGLIEDPIVLKTDHPLVGEVSIPTYIMVLGDS